MARIFTEQQPSGKIYLVCMLEPGDVQDNVTRNMYEQNRLNGLLTTYYTQEEEREFFRGDVSGCIPLSRFLQDAHTKKDVLGVFRGIAEAIRETDDYMIPLNELELDTERIFFDLQNNRIRLLCIPLLNDRIPERLQSFFKRLCSDITLTQSEDSNFLFQIQTYLNQNPLLEMEDFLRRLNEIGLTGGHTRAAAVPSEAAASLLSSGGITTPIAGAQFRIGRADDNDLKLDESHISSYHAVIEYSGGSYYLRDNRSTNHTFLNGQRLAPDDPCLLHDGDTIRFHKQEFTFRSSLHSDDGRTVVESAPPKKADILPKKAEFVPKKQEPAGKGGIGGLGGLFGGSKAQEAPPIPVPKPAAPEAKSSGKKLWEKLKSEKKTTAEAAPAAQHGSSSPFAGLKIPGMGQEELAGVSPAAPAAPSAPAPVKKAVNIPAVPIVNTETRSMPAENYSALAGERTVILDDDRDEGTIVMDTSDDAPEFAPNLWRTANGDRIPLDKQVFRLGRNPETSDYCITDGHISGNHAYIETHGTCCYLVDLDSSNHTYLNGQVLEPKQGYRLRHGDKIALHKEEFVYYEHP